jgi:glycosyltransferase involved in cell wall biosynthesis
LKNIYNKGDIEILISTMNKDSLDFLIPMFPFLHFSNFSILIVNQIEEGKELVSNYSNVRVVNCLEKGLSKSRNLALKNATGKICIIADDDIVYRQGFLTQILKAYNNFPAASVINFCAVNADEELMKNYPIKAKNDVGIFDIFNTSSIEMTINKKVLETANIIFDENFGLGGIFEMGEEAAFLSDLRKENKQIAFDPSIIVVHPELTSSDKKSTLESYYIHGALFTKIFKSKYIFWIFIKLFFDLKQNKIRLRNIIAALKIAILGHRDYRRIKYK